jgi:hypothetical protein
MHVGRFCRVLGAEENTTNVRIAEYVRTLCDGQVDFVHWRHPVEVCSAGGLLVGAPIHALANSCYRAASPNSRRKKLINSNSCEASSSGSPWVSSSR